MSGEYVSQGVYLIDNGAPQLLRTELPAALQMVDELCDSVKSRLV
jgi:hypothetical protein